jgi:anti-sigma factor RsiW
MNERVVELVYGELDGENSAGESAELARIIEADPEAKALVDQTRAFFGTLEAMPEADPPEELKGRIMNSIEHLQKPVAAPAPSFSARIANLFQPILVRPGYAMAYAFAAGLLVATAAVLTLTGPAVDDNGPVQATIGTSVSNVIDETGVVLGDVEAALATMASNGEVILEIDLAGQSSEPIQITVGGVSQEQTTIMAQAPGYFMVRLDFPTETLTVTLNASGEEQSATLVASVR